MKKIVGLCALLLLVSSVSAQTLYQVELIAFARSTAEAESEENWDRQYKLSYPERIVTLQAADSGSAPWQMLGTESMQLKREADAIASRRNWRVLLHTAWRQPVEDTGRATAIVISGGKQHGIHHELEGAFTLGFAERWLHADTQLWLSRFGNNEAAFAPTKLPNPPGAIAQPDDGNTNPPTQVVVLQEQRRLRSGELHYFDHPKFGLVVLVTPVTARTDATAQ